MVHASGEPDWDHARGYEDFGASFIKWSVRRFVAITEEMENTLSILTRLSAERATSPAWVCYTTRGGEAVVIEEIPAMKWTYSSRQR